MPTVNTLVITFHLIPAPTDVPSIAALLRKAADDLSLAVPAGSKLPDVMALRDANGNLVGAVNFAARQETL